VEEDLYLTPSDFSAFLFEKDESSLVCASSGTSSYTFPFHYVSRLFLKVDLCHFPFIIFCCFSKAYIRYCAGHVLILSV